MSKNFIVALFLLVALPALGQQILRSPSQQATLLELYTSEGCSSCPPADRWYSSLLDHPGLWQQVLPVAFHVDYWNYLGWEDRFARNAWSLRQQLHRRQGNSRAVYTPAVMVAGKEWRDWRHQNRSLPLSSAGVGVLTLRLEADNFSADFNPDTSDGEDASILNLALVGVGIKSLVRDGENRGKLLKHDFVVLDHRSYDSTRLRWQGTLPKSLDADQANRLAWVAWVSRPDNLAAVQATGGWAQP